MSKKKKHRHWFTRDEVSYILGVDRTTLDGWLNKVPKGWFLGPGQRFISFNRVRKQIEDNTQSTAFSFVYLREIAAPYVEYLG